MTTTGYNPIIYGLPSDKNTIYTAMKMIEGQMKMIEIEKPIIIVDLQLYIDGQEIRFELLEEFKDHIIQLWGFHVLEQAWTLFGKKYLGSGLEDIIVESDIFGPNAASQIMKGKNFKRCSLAHMLTYEIMCMFESTAFLKRMMDKKQLSELVAEELKVSCKNIQQAMKSFALEERTQEKQQTVKENISKLEQHLTNFLEHYDNFINERKASSNTCHFWHD